jgi:hypothetical protein
MFYGLRPSEKLILTPQEQHALAQGCTCGRLPAEKAQVRFVFAFDRAFRLSIFDAASIDESRKGIASCKRVPPD